ncbi:PRC-barrel domain-containing protein, partial [Geodermatophilus poikilotrophus]|uniref:PRC-barrel domain-containing protein n=1 Tax=Geodermatophilus poikilotrophus TaxID=1333667 RepID=UPI0011143064
MTTLVLDTSGRVVGQDIYDADGDKIGKVSEVYLDDETGRPEWATVHTGLFGTKETFVPLAQAELSGEGLRLPLGRAQVKDAPKVDTDGHLSPQEEQELYRYYGLGSGTTTDTTTQTTTGTAGLAGTAGVAGTAGH